MKGVRILRVDALPQDLPILDAAAKAEGFGMIGTLLAEGFAPFRDPGCALFAVRDGAGYLLGIGGLTRDPFAPALRMRRFYLRPEARRGGLGRAMALALLDHARAAGADQVRLRAPASAAAFWEACGFSRVADAKATHVLRLGSARPSASP